MNTTAIFPAVLAREGRIQFRSGLSGLYLGLPLVWILAARLSPPQARSLIVLIGLYSDPVMMGSLFSGVFLARERDQGLLGAWAVSPMGPGTWLAGRVTVIALQGTVGGIILVLGSGIHADWTILPWAVFFASTAGTLVGLITARPFRDILSYIIGGGLISTLICLPIAGGYLAPSSLWLLGGPAWPGWSAAAAAVSVGLNSRAAAITPVGVALAAAAAWSALLFVLTRLIYKRAFFKRRGARSAGSVVQSPHEETLLSRTLKTGRQKSHVTENQHVGRISKDICRKSPVPPTPAKLTKRRVRKNPVLSLADAFGRSTLRQPVYILLLIAPFLMGLLIRLLPVLFTRFFPAFDYKAWMPLILAVTAGFPPYLYGLLASLQLLDERDRGLLPAFRVSPMSEGTLLAAKAVPAALMAALGTVPALLLSGQADSVSSLAILAAGFIAAPSAIFYTFIATSLSRSKVQGLTAGKILGIPLLAPVLWVLTPNPWRWAATIFPSAWAGAAMTGPGTAATWFLGGFVYVSLLAVLSGLLARRNYFTA